MDQPVDRIVSRREQPVQEDVDEPPQLLLRGLALARTARRLGVPLHHLARPLHDFPIQPELVAEVIVDRRDIRTRSLADLADGHALETALGEEPLGRSQQAVPGFAVLSRGRSHSVLLKSAVAADIATTE